MWNTIKETLYVISAIATVTNAIIEIIKRFKK